MKDKIRYCKICGFRVRIRKRDNRLVHIFDKSAIMGGLKLKLIENPHKPVLA